MLKDYCKVSYSKDEFIGLEFKEGTPSVTFPRGYKLAESDEEVRRDIIHLLTILRRFSEKRDGRNIPYDKKDEMSSFPILAYQYVIFDFLSNGYYTEKEVAFKKAHRGNICWKKTIQRVRPVIDEDSLVYLKFVVKKSVNKTNLITLIHEYCVYESISKIGWLFLASPFVPKQPSMLKQIQSNPDRFVSILKDAYNSTFNRNRRMLFKCMMEIIEPANKQASFLECSFGVQNFERVWENLIDYVYGEDNKEDYFPHGEYELINDENVYPSSHLEPDTIMKVNDKLYILDAKYYKYGIEPKVKNLPPTSSIHKQITYSDYVITKRFAEENNVYNAFIIPANMVDDDYLSFVGVGTGKWIEYDKNTPNHKYVLVILLDTKYIMDTYSRHNMKEIDKMASFIELKLSSYREEKNRINESK